MIQKRPYAWLSALPFLLLPWSDALHCQRDPPKFLSTRKKCWAHAVTPSAPVATSAAYDLVSMQHDVLQDTRVKVLSNDPLIYVISDLLSVDECRAYQQYAQGMDRPMTRSNPPDVSLDIKKLWPLSILSLIAGLPPIVRLLQDDTHVHRSLPDVFQAALPNIAFAFSASLLLAYTVVLPFVRFQADRSSRTSVAIALNQLDDMEFVQDLVKRVSAITNHSWDKWEAPVITRYDPGAIFVKHGDASPTMGSEWSETGGQRLVTCICYLNTVTEGGETFFNALKFGVQPELGTALVFFPADSVSAVADDRTIHESLPPQDHKWIVQLFGRTDRVPPPLGLPDEFAFLAK